MIFLLLRIQSDWIAILSPDDFPLSFRSRTGAGCFSKFSSLSPELQVLFAEVSGF